MAFFFINSNHLNIR